jgi:hypothetical protein
MEQAHHRRAEFHGRQTARRFGQGLRRRGRFRTILIVGHSNFDELMLTSEDCRSWDTVGQWLKIFEPEFLFLAACESGRSEAVRDVFDSADSLRRIYASPVPLYKIHTASDWRSPLHAAGKGKINPEQSQALRLVPYIVSGEQLYCWRKNETGPAKN